MDEDSWSDSDTGGKRIITDPYFPQGLEQGDSVSNDVSDDENTALEDGHDATRKTKASVFAHCDALLTSPSDKLLRSKRRLGTTRHPTPQESDASDSDPQVSFGQVNASLCHQGATRQEGVAKSPFAAVDNYMCANKVEASAAAHLHIAAQPANSIQRPHEPFSLIDTCIEGKNIGVACVQRNAAPIFRREHRQSKHFVDDVSAEKGKAKRQRTSKVLKRKAGSTISSCNLELKSKLSSLKFPSMDELAKEPLSHESNPQQEETMPPSDAINPSTQNEQLVATPFCMPALSDEQEQAVNMPFNTPLLVFAGPGSGKTLFLTCRIAQAVWNNKRQAISCARNIVAVTYTRRAASELQQRVRRLCNRNANGIPWVGTLHCLALRILREVGDGGHVSVATEAERRDVIAGALGGVPDLHLHSLPGLDETKQSDSDEPPDQGQGRKKANRDRVSRIARMLTQMKRNPQQWTSAVQQNPALGVAQKNFDSELSNHNLIDLEDILPRALSMLRASAKAQSWARANVQYMFVDEWQDVDTEEANFLFYLSQGTTAVTAVGDDDQKIYGWRRKSKGLTPAAEFRNLWPVATVLTLSMNFRSMPAIVSASGKLIAHNSERESKEFKAVKEASPGENSVRVVLKDSATLEAQWIGEEIQRLRGESKDDKEAKHSRNLRPWGDFAVLARTNAALKLLEEELLRAGLPTRPSRGHSTDPSKSTQGLAMLAYLRLIVDEEHDASFLRVFNMPKRGLGKAALRCLRNMYHAPTEEQRGSPLDGIQKLDPSIVGTKANDEPSLGCCYMAAIRRLLRAPWAAPSRIAQGFLSFEQAIRVGREAAKQTKSAAEVGRVVLEAAGLLRSDAGAENDIAFERLLAEAAKYKPDGTLVNGAACVAQFLKDGAEAGAEADCVCVSTIHAAKGLEWNIVFVAQCSENVMPLQKMVVTDDADLASELEEERRLFYVAMTRAREQLFLTSGLRASNGQPAEPSRFLIEAGLIDAPSNGCDKFVSHPAPFSGNNIVASTSSRFSGLSAMWSTTATSQHDASANVVESLSLGDGSQQRPSETELAKDDVMQMEIGKQAQEGQTSDEYSKVWRAVDAAQQVASAREAQKTKQVTGGHCDYIEDDRQVHGNIPMIPPSWISNIAMHQDDSTRKSASTWVEGEPLPNPASNQIVAQSRSSNTPGAPVFQSAKSMLYEKKILAHADTLQLSNQQRTNLQKCAPQPALNSSENPSMTPQQAMFEQSRAPQHVASTERETSYHSTCMQQQYNNYQFPSIGAMHSSLNLCERPKVGDGFSNQLNSHHFAPKLPTEQQQGGKGQPMGQHLRFGVAPQFGQEHGFVNQIDSNEIAPKQIADNQHQGGKAQQVGQQHGLGVQENGFANQPNSNQFAVKQIAEQQQGGKGQQVGQQYASGVAPLLAHKDGLANQLNPDQTTPKQFAKQQQGEKAQQVGHQHGLRVAPYLAQEDRFANQLNSNQFAPKQFTENQQQQSANAQQIGWQHGRGAAPHLAQGNGFANLLNSRQSEPVQLAEQQQAGKAQQIGQHHELGVASHLTQGNCFSHQLNSHQFSPTQFAEQRHCSSQGNGFANQLNFCQSAPKQLAEQQQQDGKAHQAGKQHGLGVAPHLAPKNTLPSENPQKHWINAMERQSIAPQQRHTEHVQVQSCSSAEPACKTADSYWIKTANNAEIALCLELFGI